MRKQSVKLPALVLTGACVLLTWGPVRLAAQGKNRLSLTSTPTVGNLSSPGSNAASVGLAPAISGLGALQPSGTSGAGNVLRSSLSAINLTAPQRRRGAVRPDALGSDLLKSSDSAPPLRAVSGGPPANQGNLGDPVPLGAKRYTGPPARAVPRGPYSTPPLMRAGEFSPSTSFTTPVTAAKAYLRKIGEGTDEPVLDRPPPITTMAPREPSAYQAYMVEGERRFRNAEYLGAFTQFKLANDIGAKDAESLLSMMHARFALSRHSYLQAAYYLRQALRFQPELAVISLRPRAFYGNIADHVDQLFRLSQHLRDSPKDAEGHLVMAYYRWFDPKVPTDQARDALARALGAKLAEFGEKPPEDDPFVEAVDVFWRGMVASGRASGELKPIAPSVPIGPPGETTKPVKTAAGTRDKTSN